MSKKGAANIELIPIYTDWANKYLAKSTPARTIRDISNDFRDYRVVAQLINVIVPVNEHTAQFNWNISKTTTNLDGLDSCLNYLKNCGLDCTKLKISDIDSGNLGAVLQLLYLLSTFKQKLKQNKKISSQTSIMPPSVSKLPSPSQRSAGNSTYIMAPNSQQTTSRIQPPSIPVSSTNRLSRPADNRKTNTIGESQLHTSKLLKTSSGIKPPTNGLRSLSRGSGNNSGATPMKSSSNLNASNTNISKMANPVKTASQAKLKVAKARQIETTPASRPTAPVGLPKAVSTKSATVKTVPKTDEIDGSKLKLFKNNNNQGLKSPKINKSNPGLSNVNNNLEKKKETTSSKITPPKSGIKSPNASISKIAQIPKTSSKLLATPVNYRKEVKNNERINIDIDNGMNDQKRCSKSSEVDSAYAGFSSTSPASSTDGSMHSAASSSTSSTSSMVTTPKKCDKQVQGDRHDSTSSDDLTLNASIVRAPEKSLQSPSSTSLTTDEKPTMAVKGIKVKCNNDDDKMTSTVGNNGKHVGVVSPMTHKKFDDNMKPKSIPIDKVADRIQIDVHTNEIDDLSLVEDSENAKIISKVDPNSPIVPPQMAPIRQPPTYQQLLKQGKITSPVKTSPATTAAPIQNNKDMPVDRHVLSFPQRSSKHSSKKYEAEIGCVTMFSKMKEKLKEYDEITRIAQRGYPETFEDSSSLSSGISDNIEIDDVSTDDLSGVDMATIASCAKPNDYSSFIKPSGSRSKSSRPSRSSLAEQENIHKLLSQCRTSQRGAASAGNGYGQFSLKSPGYATLAPPTTSPHLSVSADKEIMSTAHRKSKHGYGNGFHSLDRKSHLQEYSSVDNRIAALLSPRRTPNSQKIQYIDNNHPYQTFQQQHSPGSQSARSHSRSGSHYANFNDGFQLHRLADEKPRSEHGSQLSLASTTAYASLNEKYENAIRDMSRDLESYKHRIEDLTKKQENYGALFEMFDNKLRKLTNNIERANLKPEEATRFRNDLAHLRDISAHLALNAPHYHNDGAGELLRQPSLESVASHRSTMSSSSKCSSKPDKISLNSFGKGKKSWIRSSLSKLTKKKRDSDQLPSISGSNAGLDNIDVVELKQELRDRDTVLAEVRLDALDRARQVDILQETVNKLKYENKQLKKEMDRLTSTPTRTLSHASIPLTNDDEPIYEMACSSTTDSSNSKRTSGCNSIKVTVNVDLAGEISNIVCPDNEIIVGFLAMPATHTTWPEMDHVILALFDAYLKRIDTERHLDLRESDSILGYQIGDVRRFVGEQENVKPPAEIIQPTTTIRMFMKGANQNRVDSLVLDTLLPRQMILQLVKYLMSQRRLLLAGAAGIGKSKLAKAIAAYMALRNNQPVDDIVDIKIPDDSTDELLNVERRLEKILQSQKRSIVLLDNIPKNRIAFVASVFANVPLKNDDGPYVLCTVNRYQIPEMQINQNFKMFLLTNRMEGVSGFMLRFLRRRAVEAEYRQCRQLPSEMIHVIQFLPAALQAVNHFIEKTNSIDVTIGPRVFLQCPLTVDESRQWFIRLWNENFIPYMERVAREGKKTFGRCTSFDDPTDAVCEKWPWLEGPTAEESLRRLSLADLNPSTPNSKPQFNPLESLIQLHATKHSNNIENTI